MRAKAVDHTKPTLHSWTWKSCITSRWPKVINLNYLLSYMYIVQKGGMKIMIALVKFHDTVELEDLYM